MEYTDFEKIKALAESFNVRHDELADKIAHLEQLTEAHFTASAEREQNQLRLAQQSYESLVALSTRNVKIVQNSASISAAGVKYAVQVIILAATLFFLWNQLSESQKREWANNAFPFVGLSGALLLGLPVISKNGIKTKEGSSTVVETVVTNQGDLTRSISTIETAEPDEFFPTDNADNRRSD